MKEFIFDVSMTENVLPARASVVVSLKHDDGTVSYCGALVMDYVHWSIFNLMLRCAKIQFKIIGDIGLTVIEADKRQSVR